MEELRLISEQIEGERTAKQRARRKKNRKIALIVATILVAIATILFFVILATNRKGHNHDVVGPTKAPEATVVPTEVATEVPTEASTEVPTEVPTEEPTPEPTATPVPDDWYIDPSGVIPNTVEILVKDSNSSISSSRAWCITRNEEGKTVLQMWMRSGLQKEWEVPEDMLRGDSLISYENSFQQGDVDVMCFLTNDFMGPFLSFYQDAEGRTLYFECTSSYANVENGLIMGTTDGKAIWYQWGDDFYRMHDFGNGSTVDASGGFFLINGQKDYWPNELKYKKIELGK